jgi:hypothetical protein
MKIYRLFFLLVMMSLIFWSCKEDATPAAETLTDIQNFPVEELSEAEIQSLRFMREEEKLAHDVYLFFFDKYALRTFQNIMESEQKHTESILALLTRYGIDDPAAGLAAGEFQDEDLQQLYDALIEQGSTSRVAALRVGAAIEEIDILDLEQSLEKIIDNQDITWVYESLRDGSENHLRAFVRALEAEGESYTPQYLDEARYYEIVGQ